MLPPGGLGEGKPQALTRAQVAPGPPGGHPRPSEDFPEASGAAATPRASTLFQKGSRIAPVGGGGGVATEGSRGRKPSRTDPGPGGPGAPGRSPKAIRGLSRSIRGLHFAPCLALHVVLHVKKSTRSGAPGQAKQSSHSLSSGSGAPSQPKH